MSFTAKNIQDSANRIVDTSQASLSNNPKISSSLTTNNSTTTTTTATTISTSVVQGNNFDSENRSTLPVSQTASTSVSSRIKLKIKPAPTTSTRAADNVAQQSFLHVNVPATTMNTAPTAGRQNTVLRQPSISTNQFYCGVFKNNFILFSLALSTSRRCHRK
jgi:hypothetical protein